MNTNRARRCLPGALTTVLVAGDAVLMASTLAALPATAERLDQAAERPANKDPLALDDSYRIPEDTRLLVRRPGVRANDSDPEGRLLRVRLVRGPEHGRATLTRLGQLRYTPRSNWWGTDSLVYVARDPAGNGDRARVTFTVRPVNDGPSMSFKVTTPVREGSSSRLAINATDPEGDPLTYFFDCQGNGTFEVGPVTNNVHECAYADEGSRTPAGRVRDSHGARVTAALPVQVVNVKPAVDPGPDTEGESGEPIEVDLGSFTDPGDDGPWKVKVDWGDGSSESYTLGSPGDLGSRTHTYAATSEPLEVYDVVITVSEAGNGPSGSGQLSVDVTT